MQQFDQAVVHMSAGDLAAAEQGFRALATAYPIVFRAAAQSGHPAGEGRQLEDAEKTLRSAVERNGNNAAAFNQLGIVYRKLGRFKEADEAYQRAVQIDPNYALAYLNLGVLCDLYLQQPQRALEAYERYLALASAPDAKVNSWVTELKKRIGSEPRSCEGANDAQTDQACALPMRCCCSTAAAFAAEPRGRRPQSRATAASQAHAAGRSTRCMRLQRHEPASPSESTRPQPAARRRRSARGRANDRLDLDTTVVTGNRELPKVLYIVPWKKADLGDLPAQPFNTLLDEVLTPVDRDVFRREVTYYGALSSAARRRRRACFSAA